MHDRRIDGVPLTFGNYGALFMNAMTWWDHETHSVWSQPWGRAIGGRYYGIELFLLPSTLTTWGSWKQSHPESLAMAIDLPLLARRERFSSDFVIGLLLDDQARAYPFAEVAEVGLVQDELAGQPILVWAGGSAFRAYLRTVGEQVLSFRLDGQTLVDRETGSVWDVARGVAVEGPLRGEALQPVPGLTSYDWAWLDFYPESSLYPSTESP